MPEHRNQRPLRSAWPVERINPDDRYKETTPARSAMVSKAVTRRPS
jgi:hypothetical protein